MSKEVYILGDSGLSGSPLIGSRKVWSMKQQVCVLSHQRNLGHPVRLAGKNGKRLRGKSRPAVGRVR